VDWLPLFESVGCVRPSGMGGGREESEVSLLPADSRFREDGVRLDLRRLDMIVLERASASRHMA